MKHFIASGVSILIGLVFAMLEVSGTWQVDCLRTGATESVPTVIITFKQGGVHLSGDCVVKETGEKSVLSGELDGDQITWECVSDREGTATFKGKLDGREISGSWRTAPYVAEGTFTGSKQ